MTAVLLTLTGSQTRQHRQNPEDELCHKISSFYFVAFQQFSLRSDQVLNYTKMIAVPGTIG